MNRLRLILQVVLSTIAIPMGFNDKLTQYCDHCGRSRWNMEWWDYTHEVWLAVASNINGCRHGCYCPPCFTSIAREKGIYLVWQPIIELTKPPVAKN